jgi:hypothetical protein
MSFLAGKGEMAKRIRRFDWASHPFGPLESWPQSLRSALSICLHSAFPTAIYWGPELRLLYNDAWAPIPGPRHPAALGKPAREVWADIWHIIGPQFNDLLHSGEGFFAEDQMLPMRRYGFEEETYWNYGFTAIRGEDGRIAGIFNSGHETTATVFAQWRLKFLLELNEELHSTGEPRTAIETASAMLGEHLDAVHVGYWEADDGNDDLSLVHQWTAGGPAAPSSAVGQADSRPAGAHLADLHLADFGSAKVGCLVEGQVLRIDDVESYCTASGDTGATAAFAALGIRALVAVPWMRTREATGDRSGKLTAVFSVFSAEPRCWSDAEARTSGSTPGWRPPAWPAQAKEAMTSREPWRECRSGARVGTRLI